MECERKYKTETASRTLLHIVDRVPIRRLPTRSFCRPPCVSRPCRVRAANRCRRDIVGRRLHRSADQRYREKHRPRRTYQHRRRRGDRAEAAAWSTAPRPNLLTLRRRRNDNDITTTLTTIIDCDVSLAVYRRTFFNVVTLMSRIIRLANGDSRIYVIARARFSFALIRFFEIFKQKNIGTYAAVTIMLSNTSGVVFCKDERPAGILYKVFFFSSNEIRSFYCVHFEANGFFIKFKLNKFNNPLPSR